MVEGRRVECSDDEALVLGMRAGEYGVTGTGAWYARCPVAWWAMANLSKHRVTEHEDGTITVTPSIEVTGGEGERWHGFLQRGQWTEVS